MTATPISSLVLAGLLVGFTLSDAARPELARAGLVQGRRHRQTSR